MAGPSPSGCAAPRASRTFGSVSHPAVYSSSVPSDRALVASLSAEIDRVFAALLPRGTRVALVNFPNHCNAGDPALWLGEVAALRRAGARIVHRTSWASYRRDSLARALGDDGTILLHGGGNFGDLYPHNQATTRERVLADFPRHRTIQLPQSIWFRDPANRDRLRRLCEAHADFTLLVREAQSLAIAQTHFAVPARLCPDMAFALGSRPRCTGAEVDVLWLARTDPEAAGHVTPTGAPDVAVLDWLGPVAGEPTWPLRDRIAHALNRRLHLAADRQPTHGTWRGRAVATTFAPLARRWVERGCQILSRGRVVVTDRLHGHILAVLQDIPHVVLDNNYGKLRSLYETWTHESRMAHWAESADAALALARTLAAHATSACA